MSPIFFDGCFGWLHPAAPNGPTARLLGVVLCSAFAQEEICTHHGLMLLADRLAEAGIATLRFDYLETGDSVRSREGGSLERFVESIKSAVGCLCRETGVTSVALCGIRLGGALACLAAQEIEDLAGLVLLQPVLSGRGYLRELRASAGVSSLSQLDPVPSREAPGPLNTNGFVWSAVLQDQLDRLDVSAPARLPAPQILLLSSRPGRPAAGFLRASGDLGATATETSFAQYDAFMRDPTINEVPWGAFEEVTQWLSRLGDEASLRPCVPPLTTISSVFRSDCVHETPLRFGDRNRLFGMLCRPTRRPASGVAVLILNAGSSHHIGNGGSSVTMARRLAEQGIVSLRIDIAGMGDSPAADGAGSPYYNPRRSVDVSAALTALEAQGVGSAVVVGLCAGAYLAFHSGLQDARVVGIVAVNLQKFIWRDGDSIKIAVKQMRRSLRSYLRSLRNPGEWRRVVTGQASLAGTAAILVRRHLLQFVQSVRHALPQPASSPIGQVRAWMRELAERGVQTRFVYSAEDTGLGEMTLYFGRKARRLRAYAPAALEILPNADHHLNSSAAHGRFLAFFDQYMAELVADAGVQPPPPTGRSVGSERHDQLNGIIVPA